MSEGKAQEGGRSYAEANANRAGQTSSKLAHAKGPTAAALILAHINALKMHWIALAMQQEGEEGEGAAGVHSALHEYYWSAESRELENFVILAIQSLRRAQ